LIRFKKNKRALANQAEVIAVGRAQEPEVREFIVTVSLLALKVSNTQVVARQREVRMRDFCG
jgi:hypothetical protein